jgi:hypothetical protein
LSRLILDRAELSHQPVHAAVLSQQTLSGFVYLLNDGIVDLVVHQFKRRATGPRSRKLVGTQPWKPEDSQNNEIQRNQQLKPVRPQQQR